MITNPAGTAYAKYMNNRIEARKKTVSDTTAKPVSTGLMGMARKQPVEQETLETTNRAQEMFNQVRDQRKILNNGRT